MELDAKPTMALIVTAKGLGHNSVRKSKEAGVLASCSFESQEALQVFVVQHVLHPVSSNISARQQASWLT